jgi:hypothetical protein
VIAIPTSRQFYRDCAVRPFSPNGDQIGSSSIRTGLDRAGPGRLRSRLFPRQTKSKGVAQPEMRPRKRRRSAPAPPNDGPLRTFRASTLNRSTRPRSKSLTRGRLTPRSVAALPQGQRPKLLLDPNHEVGAHEEMLRFVGKEPEISEDVSVAASHPGHRTSRRPVDRLLAADGGYCRR